MPADALRVGTAHEMAGAVTRSHLADGRCVGWFGDPHVVIDAELADQPVPPALAARYGAHDFGRRWTRAECVAKAADVPIAQWLGRHGLDGGGAGARWTVRMADVVVSGTLRTPGVVVGGSPASTAADAVRYGPVQADEARDSRARVRALSDR